MKKLIILLLFLVCFTLRAEAQDSSYAMLEKGGSGGWLNTTRPLTVEDMRGKAVLLDFWTYGCINCMQIVPDLEYLETKFNTAFNDKLLIIGVHSAKFSGEQGSSRILFAAKRFGLKHPVINDADFAIWNAYGVKAWPTQVLLGPDGKEVGRWSGEGHRDEIEAAIAKINISSKRQVPLIKKDDETALSFPARIEVLGDRFIVADAGHNQIVIMEKDGRIIERIGSGLKGDENGDFSEANFDSPRGMAMRDNKIYVADTGNHKLRMIDLKTRKVKTLFGNGKRGGPGKLASPWDVEFIGYNKLAIANAGTHQILQYDLDKEELSVLAGSGREDIIDGPASGAALAQPSGLSYYNGVLYFVDAESSALRQLKDGQVKTLIGTGLFDFGFKDGKYPEARLQHPQGLFADANRIYIADTYNDAIRIYDLKTGELKTSSFNYRNLNEPGDVYAKAMTLYIVNTNYNEIDQSTVNSRILTEIRAH